MTIAELLLDNGAFINVPGLDNDTPLHDAVENGRVACVKVLVSRGANKAARYVNSNPLPRHFALIQIDFL